MVSHNTLAIALVTVSLPDTGCSGMLVLEILICLLLCSRRVVERGLSPQHLRNYHTNRGLYSFSVLKTPARQFVSNGRYSSQTQRKVV